MNGAFTTVHDSLMMANSLARGTGMDATSFDITMVGMRPEVHTALGMRVPVHDMGHGREQAYPRARVVTCLIPGRIVHSGSRLRVPHDAEAVLSTLTRALFAILGMSGLQARAEAPMPPAAATCLACHGTGAVGSRDGVPRLAGKNPQYLAHALGMFKAGTRASPIMRAIVQPLTDEEIAVLAAYFSALRSPRLTTPPPDAALAAAGQRVAETGAGAAVPACFSCHGAGGKGDGARFPTLVAESPALLWRACTNSRRGPGRPRRRQTA